MTGFVLLIFCICVGVQLLYWLFLFRSIKASAANSGLVEHTVVMCFKNERENLEASFKKLLSQKANQFILVDDFSTDESKSVIESNPDSRVRVIQPSIDIPGKKAAIYAGVDCASSSVVVLTDADTVAQNINWSQKMASNLGSYSALLGYAPMFKTSGLINTFARYETYLTAIQYMSYAQNGMAYMGVGRNMAISKTHALPHLKEMVNSNIASGDDDMLIQAIVNSGTVGTILDPDTFVYSYSPNTFKEYIGQKARHITTSVEYKLSHQILLSLFAGTHILSFVLLIMLSLIQPNNIPFLVAVLVGKWIVQMSINWKLMNIFKERDLWLVFPLLDIATFVFYIILTPFLFIKNRSTWT